MVLPGHQLRLAFSDTLRTTAAQEAPMVQEEFLAIFSSDGHMLDTTIQNKVLKYRLTARFLACSCYLDLNHAL